jgi:hypothetical protein
MATPQAKFNITAENRTRRAVQQAEDSMRRLGRTVGDVAGTIGRIGAVTGAAAGGLAYMTDRTLDSVQQLERLADTTGFSAERIQELRFAFRATGGDVERLDDNLGEMSQRMGEAISEAKRTGGEVGEMGEGFIEAGLSIQQLENMAPEQVFQRVIRAMAQAETQTEALSIAAKTFGDEGGRAMVAFAREGADRIERLTERAREMGVVMDEDVVAGASEAADQLDTLKQILTTQFTAAIAQLGPDIAEFTGELAENPEVIKDFAADVATLAGNMATLAEKAATATGELSDLVDIASGNPGLEQQIEDQRMLVKEARSNLESLQDPGFLRSMSQGLGLDMSEEEARRQLEQRARRLTALLTMQRQRTEGLPGPFGGRSQNESDIPDSPDTGGATPDRDGRGTTPQPGMTGIDLQAARERADKFDRIWSEAVRKQHAMHESVAEENAEAYRTLDEEWAKAQKQFARLEEQTQEGSESMADAMKNAIEGWGNRFSAELNQALWESENTFDSILESFGKMITQIIIQKRLVEPVLSGFGIGGGETTTGSAHSGGIVGSLNETRTVSPAVFAGAERFHGGGLVGDERPIVAKEGEGVFTPEQMRALAPVSASGGGKTEVHIHGAPEGTETERSQTPDGGERLDVWLDNVMAEKAGDPGSRFRRRLDASTNVRSNLAVN